MEQVTVNPLWEEGFIRAGSQGQEQLNGGGAVQPHLPSWHLAPQGGGDHQQEEEPGGVRGGWGHLRGRPAPGMEGECHLPGLPGLLRAG